MARVGYGNSVEGIHAVTAAAEAGRIRRLYVQEGRSGLDDLVGLAGPHRVTWVSDIGAHARTDASQGVVAECEPIQPVDIDSLAAPDAALLALDHIEDPHNAGAIARSALAAGMTGLIMSDRRSAPLSATAFKASAGALEKLPVAIVGSVAEALTRLKKNGVWAVGLDASSNESLFGLQLLTEPVVLVVGAEGGGLSELVRKRCDVVASIPMTAGSESLNASVSAALASFEIMRVRGATAGS